MLYFTGSQLWRILRDLVVELNSRKSSEGGKLMLRVISAFWLGGPLTFSRDTSSPFQQLVHDINPVSVHLIPCYIYSQMLITLITCLYNDEFVRNIRCSQKARLGFPLRRTPRFKRNFLKRSSLLESKTPLLIYLDVYYLIIRSH